MRSLAGSLAAIGLLLLSACEPPTDMFGERVDLDAARVELMETDPIQGLATLMALERMFKRHPVGDWAAAEKKKLKQSGEYGVAFFKAGKFVRDIVGAETASIIQAASEPADEPAPDDPNPPADP